MQAPPDQIVADWFRTCRFGPSGRVPPERALAEGLGLSRAALRKALARLEAEGRLVRHVGRGTFWQGAEAAVADAPARALPTHDLAQSASPRDALHARLILEPEFARWAAVGATGRQIAELKALDAAVAAARTWPDYDSADSSFHRHIALATNNPVLVAAQELVAATVLGISWGRLRDRGGIPTPGNGVSAQHAAVTTAIADRDGPGAADALRHHLRVEASAVTVALI